METIAIKYTFTFEEESKEVVHTSRLSEDYLPLGDVVEMFQNFLSTAYGYPVTLEYNTRTDVSKQVKE